MAVQEQQQDYDYIIVGGGSAGCVLAARLSQDQQLRVALIEAGPPDKNPAIHMPAGYGLLTSRTPLNWHFETTPQPGLNGRCGYQPRGRGLGGSSSINGMVYIRGHQQDYDHWAALGNEGWDWNNMLRYFRRAQNQERGENEFHGVGGPLNVADLRAPSPINQMFLDAAEKLQYRHNPDFNGAQQDGIGHYQVTQKGGQRCSAAVAYLRQAEARDNLDVLTHAHATRIIFEERRAKKIELIRGKKKIILAAKREIILSSGAFQSPQLLLLSGIGPKNHLKEMGIDVVQHLPGVGENLQDHIDYVFLCRAKNNKDLFGFSPNGVKRLVKGLWDYMRRREGVMTSNFAESGGFISSRGDLAQPDLQWHFVIAPVNDHGRQKIWGTGYSFHVCLLRPESRGNVRLRDRDPLSSPLIDPAFFSAPEDLDTMVKGFKMTQQVLAQEPLASLCTKKLHPPQELQSDEEIKEELRNRSDTVYHPVGTCKMGTDEDEMAVLDDQLRVRGVEGLRVVDASVMPTLVSGNTNAPVIAIAEKASDLITNQR